MMEYVIVPCNETGHKTGWLSPRLTKEQITAVLGFEPNIDDDPDKVSASWGFTVNGVHCAIWDYNDERWSVYDPRNLLPSIFDPVLENQAASVSAL